MKNKLSSFSYVFLGIIFITEAVWSFCGGKIYIKYTGWIEPSIQMSIISMAIGIIFICIGIFYNSKHSDFMRCKKCHKVYNYVDVKDKICPKCGGELQD
ncbi:adenylate kinase, partial [Campylobacter ureolyticus]|uniref:adenylate kinase n=1 Tax=Campylobacter ureolyticus TaxID=827 RepID=UPI00292E1492